jgi:hypothetical protein
MPNHPPRPHADCQHHVHNPNCRRIAVRRRTTAAAWQLVLSDDPRRARFAALQVNVLELAETAADLEGWR